MVLEKSGRKGQITWGVIEKEPHKLIPARFLLETKIGNPTRIGREEVETYWQAWATMEAKGKPFSFFSWKGKGREQDDDQEQEDDEMGGDGGGGENEKGDEEEGGEEEAQSAANKIHHSPTLGFKIDKNIPLPCECKTPDKRTACLKLLGPGWGSAVVVFLAIVKLVDALEVGPM